MKNRLLLLVLIFSFTYAKAQLVSYEFIQSYSVNDLTQVIADFGAAGLIVPQYEVDLYRVYYRTEYNDSTTVVTGALALPKNLECKPSLFSYQHGTTSLKTGVPSYGSSELQICVVFASEGNVMVAPDYIGLGGSTINIHPYQHGYSQAHSTINLLRATRQLQTDLNFELNNQLYLFGYSQGGHATAAATMYIEQYYSNEFQITASMPMSGAFDLAGVQTDFVNSGLPYATPGYLPYIVMGFQSVYHDLYDSIQEIFVPPYDSLMPYLFYSQNYGIGYINNQAMPIPLDMFTQAAEDAFNNDPNFPFKVHLEENTLLSWTPQSKMRMYYCTGDEQVYFRNSVVADSVWNYNGAPDVAAVYLTNEDHGGCVDNALIAAKVFTSELLNNGVEILVNYNEASNSFELAVLNDDIANYDIEWNNGSTAAVLNNVIQNVNYTVTLTDKVKGCSNSKTFTTQTLTGIISNKSKHQQLSVYPNPSSQYILIDYKSAESKTIYITNAIGERVIIFENPKFSQAIVNVAALPSGTYFVTVLGQENYKTSFIKK